MHWTRREWMKRGGLLRFIAAAVGIAGKSPCVVSGYVRLLTVLPEPA